MTDPPGIDTLAARSGEDEESRALADPLWQTAPFWFRTVSELREAAGGRTLDHFYSRYGNPTVSSAERKMAALEGTDDAVLFSSGIAAIAGGLSSVLAPGDRLVAIADLYGGTLALFREVLEPAGIGVDLVETAERPRFEAAMRPETRLIYVETPTNPLVKIVDLSWTADLARSRGILCAVDSTFGTPVLQKPAALGFDLVLHSATKYLNGHADVTAGFACAGRELGGRIRSRRKTTGPVPDPHAAWLLTRGMKTLGLRVRQQSSNAAALADHLASHPAVSRVHYPGRPDHPGHDTARRQMAMFGAMLAFDLRGGRAHAERAVEGFRLIRLATSLGSLETTADLPAVTSHSPAMIDPEKRDALGITEATVRLSVGCENVEDLRADLARALDRLATSA